MSSLNINMKKIVLFFNVLDVVTVNGASTAGPSPAHDASNSHARAHSHDDHAPSLKQQILDSVAEVTEGGVLQPEEMQHLMSPHGSEHVEAASSASHGSEHVHDLQEKVDNLNSALDKADDAAGHAHAAGHVIEATQVLSGVLAVFNLWKTGKQGTELHKTQKLMHKFQDMQQTLIEHGEKSVVVKDLKKHLNVKEAALAFEVALATLKVAIGVMGIVSLVFPAIAPAMLPMIIASLVCSFGVAPFLGLIMDGIHPMKPLISFMQFQLTGGHLMVESSKIGTFFASHRKVGSVGTTDSRRSQSYRRVHPP